MRTLRRTAGGAAVAGLIAGGVLAMLPAASAPAEPLTSGPVAAESPFAATPPRPDIVVIGIPGLRWSDLQRQIPTPGLWLMARDSALAALSVRTAEPTACPLDGWLTLNSGVRSIGPRPGGDCTPVPAPRVETGSSNGTANTRATFENWAQLVAPNAGYSYEPVWGTLAGARPGATASADEHRCAVGPGAAVALTDGTGRVRARYAADLDALDARECSDLLLVDAGALPLGGPRAAALRAADDLVREVRAALPDSALLVAGIADSDPDRAHLSAVMAEAGEDALEQLRRGWLRSESTRRTGIVTVTDLTPTLLRGPIPAELDGSPLQYRARIESTPRAVRELDRRDIAAQVVRENFVPFFIVLIAGQLLAYGAAALALRRGRVGRTGCARAISITGLAFGAAPAASLLANLLPWRAAGPPAVALWLLLIAGSALIATFAFLGPWRRHPYGSAGAVAAITTAVFALDVVTGSKLEINSLFGLSPLIAGRFYGFGNISFAVFAMCTLVAAAALGADLVRRGHARVAALVVTVVGALAVLVDGWPSFGADFGGVLALMPGVAVLAAGVAALRVTVWRVLAVGALTVATVSAIALLDWRREPAARSHLGRFVQDVLDGEGLDVIGRKADANLGLLVDAPVIVLAAAPLLVLIVLALVRPERLRLSALARAQAADPVLRPLLLACLSTGLLGFAVNDSGVIVPAVALLAAGPLIIAIWARLWAREPAA